MMLIPLPVAIGIMPINFWESSLGKLSAVGRSDKTHLNAGLNYLISSRGTSDCSSNEMPRSAFR